MNARWTAAALVAFASACSSPDDPSGELHLVLVQAPTSITPGAPLQQSLIVRVVNADGQQEPGVPVTWSVVSGGGVIDAWSDTSGVDGLAAARWTPGVAVGQQQVAASIYDQPALTITVDAEAFHADKIATAYTMGCGLQGTAVWCWDSRNPATGTRRTLSQFEAYDLAMTTGYICVLDGAGSTYCHYALGDLSTGEFLTIPGLPALSSISGGGATFCGISRADSTPWCWRHGDMTGVQVSSSLLLSSISSGSYGPCGLTAAGAAWCWSLQPSSSPVPVPGGHAFRSISVGGYSRCAIEAPTSLYCWTSDDLDPRPVVGAFSPTQVAIGAVGDNLMNTSSGTLVFYLDYDAPGSITLVPGSEFPLPVKQLGDACVLAFDGAVYCVLYDYYANTAKPFTWNAVAVPRP